MDLNTAIKEASRKAIEEGIDYRVVRGVDGWKPADWFFVEPDGLRDLHYIERVEYVAEYSTDSAVIAGIE